MLQNAYFLAKIGADTAENEQHFAEILPKTGNYPTAPPRGCLGKVSRHRADEALVRGDAPHDRVPVLAFQPLSKQNSKFRKFDFKNIPSNTTLNVHCKISQACINRRISDRSNQN